MATILQDLSPRKIVHAIEENLSGWIPFFGMLGQWHLDNPPGVKRSISDIPFSLFNSVMDARLTTDKVDAAIEQVISDAKRRNVPLLWWLGPSSQPADLGSFLERHGFTLDEHSPGMAVELSHLNERLPKPAGFSIRLAQDEAAWTQWGITCGMGFGDSSPNEHALNAWCSIFRQAAPGTLWAYTAFLEEKPVSTSLLFLAGGVAGIYGVATIPEARRKGIGALVTLHPLLQARSLGYAVGVLEASEMGVGVYRSLGFQEYCRIVSYVWRPVEKAAG